MSNLLSQASLVMIPSGYKEDVVYSPVPTDGSGDLSFTRASNGTRINSAGLVEVCPWNLVQNSENFDAVWAKYNGATVTVNAITAPNGTTTADLLIAGASQEVYSANMPKVAEELYYTFSCYAKVYNTNVFRIVCSDFSTSGSVGTFDLSTQSATFATGATWSNVSASMESVGNGWYRCILSGKSPATTGLYLSLLTNGTNSVSGVYIWGAQVNIGSTAKPYFPTTDRLNVPRLTYQNGGGGCPSLLLEKQSTNLLTYSEQFDNAAWNLEQTFVTANQTISPDGTQNADSLTENGANDHHLIYQGGTYSSGSYTASVFIKKNTRQYAFLQIATDGAVNRYTIVVDLNNGTMTASSTAGLPTGTSYKIDSMGNGWYRIAVTATHTALQVYSVFGLSNSATPTFNAVAIPTYTGNGTSNIYIYGAQVEASSYPTSYIPTTSSSATRVADSMTVNLPNTNMTFTAYLECEEAPLGTTAGDWFAIYSSSSILGRAYGYANGFGFADSYAVGETSGTKMVWKQESGTTAKIFKNGVLVGTSTTGAYSLAFNRFAIYAQFLDKPVKIKQFVFFDNALTDAECIQLTA